MTNCSLNSKRVSIIHYHQLKHDDKIKFDNDIASGNATISEKVDGFGLRIGVLLDGTKFIETSRSGIITIPGSFYSYTSNKTTNKISLERSIQFDNLFDMLLNSEIYSIIKPGVKVFFEALYKPMAKIDGSKIKFVNCWYDLDKIDRELTLVYIKTEDLLTRETWSNDFIYEDDKIVTLNPYINILSIKDLDLYSGMFGDYEGLIFKTYSLDYSVKIIHKDFKLCRQ